MTKPEQCPKYERCNAPICPLHEQWRRARHLPEEAVCLWLREWSKADGEARVGGTLQPDLVEAVSVAYREISSGAYPPELGHGVIRRVLRRSAKSGSKLASAERLHRGRG